MQPGGFQPRGGTSTNVPAWLAVGLGIPNPVNFVQFDAAFTDTNAAQGLLTVYWNANQIGMVDERVAATNWQTYRFQLPGMVSSGLYTLSFRLDSFNNSSSLVVTNVATGFVGLTQPIKLGISITNHAPMVKLVGPSGYNYLLQTSTNLVSWTSIALLANTRMERFCCGLTVTNASKRFYRVVLYSVHCGCAVLQARVAGKNFILSWPTNATGYVLQTTTNLAAANSWTAVTNAPATVNQQSVVTNQISGKARFYRLKQR